ncbi:MAG: hypothetical protein ACRDFS_10100 [Chloroflexota bacterium]
MIQALSALAPIGAVLPTSAYPPLAIGFFGLGTGYFIWGGQSMFNFPPASKEVDQSIGAWGIWMPGFMQFLAGTYIFVGITVLNVFATGSSKTPLYMAGLAFTAYGVHWFSMGWRRYIGAGVLPDAWMAITFAVISILGIVVFFGASDTPVAIVFILLTLIYLSEAAFRFFNLPMGGKLVALWQLLNGIWLMYLTFAATLNASLGYHWWI